MKTTTILRKLEANPDLANYFGVTDNLDLESMFGKGSLTGERPQGEYAWFWCDECPFTCPDFVYEVVGNSKVYGFLLY